MKIKIDPKQPIGFFLKTSGMVINNKYYNLPFWFEEEDGSMFLITLQDLPQSVKDLIKKERDGV